ncbi:MAG: HDIG domain-containing protein [Chlorobi bacterium]|nr:HDIG domain-containing protein [Chlorobiota bacterium]
MRFHAKLFRSGPVIYRVLVTAAAVLIMSYLLPLERSPSWKYETGAPWAYEDLYAPFSFRVESGAGPSSERVWKRIPVDRDSALEAVRRAWRRTLGPADDSLTAGALKVIQDVYERGLLPSSDSAARLPEGLSPYTPARLRDFLSDTLKAYFGPEAEAAAREAVRVLPPSFRANTRVSNPPVWDIPRGRLIVARGQTVTPATARVLKALEDRRALSIKQLRRKRAGYVLALALLMTLLVLYLQEFAYPVYESNSEFTLVIFLVTLMVALYYTVAQYVPDYIYVVPVALAAYMLRSFFNRHLALVVTWLIVLLAAFAVSSPLVFIAVQFAAVWTAVIASGDLTSRSHMFGSALKVVGVYIFMYIAMQMFVHGGWDRVQPRYFLHFMINGFLSVALIHEMILIFEKIFGTLSDISLLELLNTDNKLLKKLAEKAPGTFQHSLQVANLSEAVANELGANSLLVRVGALYHDIGKMKNPRYFTENRTGDFNPHDDLPPARSARIIIQHVIDGIETARRNGLPEKVIDFIRTHHGTDVVQYFYEKAKQEDPSVREEDFRYPGPDPFSKETAIVMMADSVEAASKSLKDPTREQLDALVDKIIDRKLQRGLFDNADITLREINEAKKVLKKKLRSIYHPRVAYPGERFDK